MPHGGWPEWADQLAVKSLHEALRADRVGHAFLITGPNGVGKSELAIAFSQALCCTNIRAADPSQPCGECRACRNVVRRTHPDVEIFDLESQAAYSEKPARGASLSIDTIRRLRASATLLPLESARRILIIEDAESMLEPAQQALLKTLEDPPRAVTLVLLADEQELLLETVRSRCRHVIVRPVALNIVQRSLEVRGVEPRIAAEIATLSRGCPAWALRAANDPKLLQGRRSEWNAAIEWIRSPEYERLITAFRYGDQFNKRRAEVIGVVQAAVQLLRSEMLRLVEHQPEDSVGAYSLSRSPASAFGVSQAVRGSMQCLADLDANVRPRLALEAMVMSWPNLELQAL